MNRTVIVLNHFAQPPTSPGGTRHVELFSKLQGWDARVVAADRNMIDGSRVAAGGVLETVRVTPFAGNGVTRVLSWCSYAASALVRVLPARRVDLVYGSTPHLLAALAGWMIARIRRVPFVLEVRDVWPRVLVDMGALAEASVAYRVLHRLERFLYRRADRLVILAEGVREHLLRFEVPNEMIVFVPNGADADDFVATAPRVELRKRYGFRGIVAVYAGAHGPANGLDLVLGAAAELAVSCPDLQIVLVGDGALKPELVERAGRERLTNVHFMDPVPKAEIRDVLAAADIGVHCLADVELFHTSVSPNKLFDYMAAGLAVITNTPGEVAAFIHESGGGLAVPPAGLAAGLKSLCGLTESQRSELGALGRTHLDATRSRAAMAASIESMLDDVVPVNRRPTAVVPSITR